MVSPTGRSQHLKLVLFAPSGEGQQYVAAGSLGLDSLLGSDTPHQRVSVPVVDEASLGRWWKVVVGTRGMHACAALLQQPSMQGPPPLPLLRHRCPLCCPPRPQVGKHAGEVSCTLCFPSRAPSAAEGEPAAGAGASG